MCRRVLHVQADPYPQVTRRKIGAMSTRPSLACLAAFVLFAGHASADVRLPGVISDHMLLQRDMPARIFGNAEPGGSRQRGVPRADRSTRADALGRWEVWLQPLTPGPAASMTIRGTNTITIADVLVGDVWVGSGQSNMQWAVRQSDNADGRDRRRPCSRRSGCSTFPANHRQCQWKTSTPRWVVCSPETIAEFSAVLYYFGREMHAGPQGAHRADPLVVGRHAHRVVDQRSVACRQRQARAVPHVLGRTPFSSIR